MRNRGLIALITILVFSLTGCPLGDFLVQTDLPKEMPDGTVMTYSDDGGMTPTWIRIEIKNGELNVKEKKANEESETRKFCPLTKDEVSEVYGKFVESKFEIIENEANDEIIYDAGSRSLRISTGKINHSVSSGPNAPLSRINNQRFDEIVKSITGLATMKEDKLKPLEQ